MMGGVILMVAGTGGSIGGGLISLSGVGAAIGVPAAAVSAGLVTAGAGNVMSGLAGLGKALSTGGGDSSRKFHKFSGMTVEEILKGKKGSITKAPLEKGAPAWSEIKHETWESVVRKADKDVPGYKTIKKLLADKRFDR
ncbi:MAG: hypothetical protein HUU21_40925 [Polyangiaceae bacterium]|nr:hypothetical protein [Polyangiaceae bacterium]